MSVDFGQVFIQIIGFLIMLWILKRYGWKPLLEILHQRQEKIQSEFDAIEEQKKVIANQKIEYQEMLKGIEIEARHKIQEAVMQGRTIAKEIQEEAQISAKAILRKAKEEVENEIVKARNQLKNDMVNLSVALAEKILNESIDQVKHHKLIADFVKETELK